MRAAGVYRLDCAGLLRALMLWPKDLKKSHHVARCALMDEERQAFTELADTLLTWFPPPVA